MQKTLRRAVAKKPEIHISETDYDLVSNFATVLEARAPALARMIFDELERAHVHGLNDLPDDVVTLGAEVSYLDESTGTVRRVRLVLPAEADIDGGMVSILTPVGAGLLGLKAGQSIDWPCPDGRPRTLKILEVRQKL